MPHRRVLYVSALHLTRNADDAEDLVQETLMRAYSAWDRFVSGSNCRAWLLRIQRNSFINTYRKQRRHQRFTNENRDDAIASVYGREPNRYSGPEKKILSDAFGDEVTVALESLRRDYRQVVELADVDGVRYRDIAEHLQLPIGTVMSRLFRARRQLQEHLAGFAAEDYGIMRAA